MARLNGVVPTIGINSGRLLRRQRRAARRLRRHHRHRGLEHRHGRPGDDRGRRPRRVLARRGRPDRRAGGQRRRRHRRPRRGRGRRRRQAVPVVLPGSAADVGVRRPAHAALDRPGNRLRTYDIRKVIEGLADTGSVLELRRHFGLGMVTALCPHRGSPGRHPRQQPEPPRRRDRQRRLGQGGPLHAAAATPSTSRSLVLCDTPGIMVGPEVEKTGLVRHCNRLFVTGANLTVPMFMVVLRKAYGLGALAMAGGSVMEPFFCVAWPTGEFAGMGLEGQIKLGYRNELASIDDPAERWPASTTSSPRPTSAARRSTRASRSASTTSSTRWTPGTGWPTGCARSPAATRPARAPAGRRLVTARPRPRRPARRRAARLGRRVVLRRAARRRRRRRRQGRAARRRPAACRPGAVRRRHRRHVEPGRRPLRRRRARRRRRRGRPRARRRGRAVRRRPRRRPLDRRRPGLVVTWLSPFGRSGPLAGWASSDLVQLAMSLWLQATGGPSARRSPSAAASPRWCPGSPRPRRR